MVGCFALNCQWQLHHHRPIQDRCAPNGFFVFINLFWFGLDFFCHFHLLVLLYEMHSNCFAMTIKRLQLIETTRFMNTSSSSIQTQCTYSFEYLKKCFRFEWSQYQNFRSLCSTWLHIQWFLVQFSYNIIHLHLV